MLQEAARLHGQVIGEPTHIVTPNDRIPNFAQTPNKTASTGNWSSPSTWTPPGVPTQSSVIMIPSGVTVTLDTTAAVADTIGIHGKLRFRTDAETKLTVGNTLIYSDGELEVGTAVTPVSPAVKAEIVIADRPLETSGRDPQQFGTSIIALGKVTMHGAVKNPTFVRVAAEPRAGQTSIQLEQAVTGWRAGDRVFVPDSRQFPEAGWFNPNWALQHDEATVQSISTDGKTITIFPALRFDHLGARDADTNAPSVTSNSIKLLPHVGNLTRNVIISSQNPNGTRGHMMNTVRADVDIRYVQFQDMGRTKAEALDSTTFNAQGAVSHVGTNQIGRYPLHIHHLWGPVNPSNAGYQFELIGNAVADTLKWPIAVHRSHYGLVKDNVIYGGPKLSGAGIALEDGTETENMIEHNFVANIQGYLNGRNSGPNTGNGSTPGSGAECYWAAGFNSRFVDNVAAGCRNPFQGIVSGPCFKFVTDPARYNVENPRFRGADMLNTSQTVIVVPQLQPLLEFRGNECYNSSVGLTAWHLGTDGYDDQAGIQESLVKDFRVWHAWEAGIMNYPANHMTIDSMEYRVHAPTTQYFPPAFYCGDYRSIDLTIRGGNIHAGAVYSECTAALKSLRIENVTAVTKKHAFEFPTPATPGTQADMPDPPGFTAVLKNNRVRPWAGRTLGTIHMYYTLQRGNNHPDMTLKVFSCNHQGQPGDNFQAYFAEQYTSDTIAGGRAPCNTTRADIDGYVCVTPEVASACGTSSSDTQPPAVSVTAPANNASVQGTTVAIAANASDNAGIFDVQFQINGQNVGAPDTTAPYTMVWNTIPINNGTYTIRAIARDTSGNSTTSNNVTVTVANPPDTTPPTVSITSPANDSTANVPLTLSADASDNVFVASVQFKLDGVNIGSPITANPYSMPWDPASTTNGAHALTAVARDLAGNQTTSSAVNITVATPPALRLAMCFEEGSGTSVDDKSTFNNDGTIVDATWVTNGKNGRALSFNGSAAGANHVRVDNVPLPTGDFTWSAWIYPTSFSDYQNLLGGYASGDAEIEFTTHTNGAMRVWFDGSASAVLTTSPVLTLNAWHHVALRRQGGQVTVIVNGTQQSNTYTDGDALAFNCPLYIGADIDGPGCTGGLNSSFSGRIDDVRVYSRALSATEITTDMNTPVCQSSGGDTQAPVVSLTAPANNATVANNVTVSATATDNVGVVGVQFKLDGANLGAEDATAPFSVSWDTTQAANGTHTLTAVARDTAGNTTTSSPVTVTVNNQASNLAPAVNVGLDQSTTLPAAVSLNGTVTDDGLPNPPASTTRQWTKVSGPGTVTFSTPTSVSTTASFSTAGTYVLRLTASDSALSATDDVQITVNAAPVAPVITSFTINPSSTATVGQSVAIAASITDSDSSAAQVGWVVYAKRNALPSVEVARGQGFSVSASFSLTSSNAAVGDDYAFKIEVQDQNTPMVFQWAPPPPGTLKIVAPPNQPPSIVSFSATATDRNPSLAGVQVYRADAVAISSTQTDPETTPFYAYYSKFGANPGQLISQGQGTSGSASFSIPANAQPGDVYTIVLNVSDGTNTVSQTSQTFTVIAVPNQPPSITSFSASATDRDGTTAGTQVYRGDTITLSGTVSDPDSAEVWTIFGKRSDQPGGNPVGQSGRPGPDVTATFTAESAAPFGSIYTFKLEVTDGTATAEQWASQSFTVIDVPNNPPVVNAGTDQTITLPAFANLDATVSDDGNPVPPGALTALWIKVSGPGTVTFGDSASVDTTASFSTDGTYTLRLRVTDGVLITSDDVQITVRPEPPTNQPPSVSAGADQTITLPSSASLDGTVTDDGLPNPPASVSVTWSKVSGPGTVTFRNANAVDTTASFSTAGTYTLRLTASDGALSANHSITVVVQPQPPANQPPSVSAGSDQTITLPSSATLDGTVADDGLPSGAVTMTWSKISGPGTVTFGNANAVDTTASFSAAGTYTLWLTASDGALTRSDDLAVTVNAAPTVNQPPSITSFSATATDRNPSLAGVQVYRADAGAISSTQTDPETTPFYAYYSKFGANPGQLISQGQGTSGSATFAIPANAAVGDVYTVVLNVSDGTNTVSQTSQAFTVIDVPNTPPSVNAGSDQTITLPAFANLDATVSDDGNPVPPGALTALWTKLSGPGTVTFGDASSIDTTADFSAPGTYTLRLRVSDGALNDQDDVRITVNPAPPVNQPPAVSAGGDLDITLPATATLDGTVTDDGLPNPPATVTVQWSKVSGPGQVTFADDTSIDTTAAFSEAGTYVLRLTADDSARTNSHSVTVRVAPAVVPATCVQLTLEGMPSNRQAVSAVTLKVKPAAGPTLLDTSAASAADGKVLVREASLLNLSGNHVVWVKPAGFLAAGAQNVAGAAFGTNTCIDTGASAFGDLDQDGDIDVQDFALLRLHFRGTPHPVLTELFGTDRPPFRMVTLLIRNLILGRQDPSF